MLEDFTVDGIRYQHPWTLGENHYVPGLYQMKHDHECLRRFEDGTVEVNCGWV